MNHKKTTSISDIGPDKKRKQTLPILAKISKSHKLIITAYYCLTFFWL